MGRGWGRRRVRGRVRLRPGLLRAALVAAVTAAAVLAGGCGGGGGGDEGAYCERARAAFEELGGLSADGGDPAAALERVQRAFAGLDQDAPEEVREDVVALTGYVAGVTDGDQLGRPEPPEVQAAGRRFATWLGEHCDAAEP